MLFYTHIFLGIVSFLLMGRFFNGGNEIIFFFLVLIGSVLPDIDEAKSKVNKSLGMVGWVVSFFSKHRGMFHSAIFGGLLFLVISLVSNSYYGYGLLIGYFAHILGDGLTPRGIKLFYPFSEFKIKGPLRVGGVGEWALFVGLVVIVIRDLLFGIF